MKPVKPLGTTQQEQVANVFKQVYAAHPDVDSRCAAIATVSIVSQDIALTNVRRIREIEERAAIRRELILTKALAFAVLRLEEFGLRRSVEEVLEVMEG